MICCAPGCDDLAIDGLAHCEQHEAARQDKIKASRARAKTSAAAQAGSALYKLAAWRKASRAWLRNNPICVDCDELGLVVLASEVDHVAPHRGDRQKFWDRSNWQSLCKPCHSRKTAREVLTKR